MFRTIKTLYIEWCIRNCKREIRELRRALEFEKFDRTDILMIKSDIVYLHHRIDELREKLYEKEPSK